MLRETLGFLLGIVEPKSGTSSPGGDVACGLGKLNPIPGAKVLLWSLRKKERAKTYAFWRENDDHPSGMKGNAVAVVASDPKM